MSFGYTFDDLRVRVAEYLGTTYKGTSGLEKAQIPQDDFNIDVVSRVVNDGYKRFITEYNWEFMTPLASITFAAQTYGTITTGGTGTFTDMARTEDTASFNGQNLKVTRSDGSHFVTVVETSTSSGVFTFADGTLVFATGDTYSISTAVDGENHRYLMPEDFTGVVVRDFTYGLPQGAPLLRIRKVSEDDIRALRSGGTTATADPRLVGFRPIEVDGRPRMEATFWPSPGTLRTIFYRYRRYPVDLTVGTQVPICGAIHDPAILAACRAEAELKRFDKLGPEEKTYQARLAISKRRDRESRPHNLGDFGDRSDGPILETPTGLVDTFDNMDIS